MLRLSVALMLAPVAMGQPPVAPAASDTLPQITVGAGPSWTRGDAHAISADVDIALRLGSSNVFSWSTISTPVARVPAGSPPLPSTITTGIAYLVARSTSGSVSLIGIAQGGFDSVPASALAPAATSAAFSGSVGLTIRIGKRNLYLMPFIRAAKPTRGTDGSLVSAILQPGLMLIYGFGSAK